MSESLPPLEERFKSNLLSLSQFIGEIITDLHRRHFNVPHPKLIRLLAQCIKEDKARRLIKNFARQTQAIWDPILDKRRQILIDEGDRIFRGIPLGDHNFLGVLEQGTNHDGTPWLSEEERISIWAHLLPLVLMSREYLQEN